MNNNVSDTLLLATFCKARNVRTTIDLIIDSFEILKNYQEDTLWVTKYDSHANNKAHFLIAKFLEKKLFYELNSLH